MLQEQTQQRITKNIPDIPGAFYKSYFHTVAWVPGESTINFFPSQAPASLNKANYTSNPFPGKDYHLIYAMNLGLNHSIIKQGKFHPQDKDEESWLAAIMQSNIIVQKGQSRDQVLLAKTHDYLPIHQSELTDLSQVDQSTGDLGSIEISGHPKASLIPEPIVLEKQVPIFPKLEFGAGLSRLPDDPSYDDDAIDSIEFTLTLDTIVVSDESQGEKLVNLFG